MADRSYPVRRDGVDFEVRASSPEEAARLAQEVDLATVPRVIYRSGSTRVLERPNGQRYVVSPGFSSSDPKAVEQVMAGAGAGEVSRRGIQESLVQQYPAAATAAQFARGALGGGSYLDELLGKMSGPGAATGARALSEAMQETRPGQSALLNIAGGLTSAAGMAAAAPAALTGYVGGLLGSGPRIAQMAKTGALGAGLGAIEGGIYGFGEGETPEQRAQEARRGAALGGVVGGAVGMASPIVEAGARNVMSLVRRSDIAQISAALGISPNAARVIKGTFEVGGDFNDAAARLQAAGREGMLADAGPAAQALLDAAMASGPAGAQTGRTALEERMSRISGRMESELTRALGQPALGPQTAVSEIQARTRGPRQAAYQQAFDTPIDYASEAGSAIEDALSRVEPNIMRQAIERANAEMRDLNLTNQQIMADIADDGTVAFREMPNVRQLNQLKIELDQLSEAAKRQEGVVTIDTAESIRYRRQAARIRDALIEATGGESGAYAQALKIGGDTIAERRAFMLGERLLDRSTRIEDVMLDLGQRPSQTQLEAARRGLRTRIEQIIGDVRRIPSDPNIDARQALETLREMSSDNAREKVRRLMGGQADQMFRMLDEAMVAAETRAATSVNSRTQIRRATEKFAEDVSAPGVIGEALRGRPINTTERAVQAITGLTEEYTAQQKQKLFQDIARALTQKKGREAQDALRMLANAMLRQNATEQETRDIASRITKVLGAGAAPTLGREMQGNRGPR